MKKGILKITGFIAFVLGFGLVIGLMVYLYNPVRQLKHEIQVIDRQIIQIKSSLVEVNEEIKKDLKTKKYLELKLDEVEYQKKILEKKLEQALKNKVWKYLDAKM